MASDADAKFFEHVKRHLKRLTPSGCNVETLSRLLISWFAWRDEPPYVLLAHALEADPQLVLALCSVTRFYTRLGFKLLS